MNTVRYYSLRLISHHAVYLNLTTLKIHILQSTIHVLKPNKELQLLVFLSKTLSVHQHLIYSTKLSQFFHRIKTRQNKLDLNWTNLSFYLLISFSRPHQSYLQRNHTHSLSYDRPEKWAKIKLLSLHEKKKNPNTFHDIRYLLCTCIFGIRR